MSVYLKQQLGAFGAAHVIVVLKPQHRGSERVLARLEKCFSWSDRRREVLRRTPQKKGARRRDSPMQYLPNLGIAYGRVDRAGWENLRAAAGEVASLHGAPPLRPIRARNPRPSGAPEDVAWGLRALGIPKLWQLGLTGKGVRVGHLDTGVDGTHPALREAVAAFAQFDALGKRVAGNPPPVDSATHGTHTAGTIAGRPVEGRQIGVAPGCQLVSGMVIEGGDEVARVLAGVDWAIGENIRVLSLSLGFPGFWKEFVPVVKMIRARGILPVFAVGNDGPESSRSPGNYAEAVSVGAVDRNGEVDPESSSQRFDREEDPLVPDLVMPGVGIISADVGGGFRQNDGTSMAAAHMSGLAALLWEAKPEATVEEIERCVYGSCKLPEHSPEERANRGMPNAELALTLLGKPPAAAAAAGGG